MRVTYIGYDYFSPVLLHLVGRQDVRIMRVVTAEQAWAGHVRSIAARCGLELVLSRVRRGDLERFAVDSDLVLCASYDYRLAIPAGTGCRFLNIHPSLLPLGRGPAPGQWTLTEEPESAGVSLHEMDAGLDTGPVVSQVRLSAPAGCSFERYTHLVNQAAIALVAGLDGESLRRLTPTSQDGRPASYNPLPPEQKRTILPSDTGLRISELVAAMGPLGAFVTIDGAKYLTTRVEAIEADPTGCGPAYVNHFYGYYPCANGYCLFHRSNLTQIAAPG